VNDVIAVGTCYIELIAVQTDARRVCTNFIFMLEFRDTLDEVTTDAKLLSLACIDVQESAGLKALLLKARDLGNLANQRYAPGGRTASVGGIAIARLQKLRDIKAIGQRGDVDLMSFLVSKVQSNEPGLVSRVRVETTNIGAARHCSMEVAKVGLEEHVTLTVTFSVSLAVTLTVTWLQQCS